MHSLFPDRQAQHAFHVSACETIIHQLRQKYPGALITLNLTGLWTHSDTNGHCIALYQQYC